MRTEHYLVHVLGILYLNLGQRFACTVRCLLISPRCVCCRPFKGSGGDLGLVLSRS